MRLPMARRLLGYLGDTEARWLMHETEGIVMKNRIAWETWIIGLVIGIATTGCGMLGTDEEKHEQARQLAAVLIQLPPQFKRTPPNRSHLAALLDKLHGLPLAVEFRHNSWAVDRVFSELERRRVTLVTVDEPELPGLFPALDVVTNPELFYVRFHGRNAKSWRSGNMQLQFDYSYTDDELCEWVEKKIMPMSSRAGQGIIFFNNHVRAQATENALRMSHLLKDYGLTVS